MHVDAGRLPRSPRRIAPAASGSPPRPRVRPDSRSRCSARSRRPRGHARRVAAAALLPARDRRRPLASEVPLMTYRAYRYAGPEPPLRPGPQARLQTSADRRGDRWEGHGSGLLADGHPWKAGRRLPHSPSSTRPGLILAILAGYDAAKTALRDIVDMPDRRIDPFIRLCVIGFVDRFRLMPLALNRAGAAMSRPGGFTNRRSGRRRRCGRSDRRRSRSR